MNSVPSSMRTPRRPLTWYWKCWTSQLWVPASGLTSLDQRQPGWNTNRPTDPPPISRISARPLGNSRTSSGWSKPLCWQSRCVSVNDMATACARRDAGSSPDRAIFFELARRGGDGDRRSAGGHAEADEDVRDVAVHGVLAHDQLLCDLPVREALSDERQHLAFAPGEIARTQSGLGRAREVGTRLLGLERHDAALVALDGILERGSRTLRVALGERNTAGRESLGGSQRRRADIVRDGREPLVRTPCGLDVAEADADRHQ